MALTPHTQSGEEVGNVQEIEHKSTSDGKLKRHFRKLWWLYLIVFIACTLILVLCLLFVAFPHRAQHDVNKSSLHIESLILSNPAPKSFHLKQTAVLENNSSYHPNLDAFNASLSLDGGKPFGYVELPTVHATAKATTLIDQDVIVTDLDAFTEYNIAVLQSEQVKVAIKGKTKLHEMRFPTTTVNYDKTVAINGLNSLTGFTITNFTISLTPAPDGSNLLGTLYIPNPSPLTLTMGNVTFTNYLANTSTIIGTTTLTNLTLVPGNNTLPFTSATNQTLVIEQLTSGKFQGGMLPVDIVGTSSVYEGQHLTYFEKALGGLKKTVTLNVGAALGAVGVDLSVLSGSGDGGGGAMPLNIVSGA